MYSVKERFSSASRGLGGDAVRGLQPPVSRDGCPAVDAGRPSRGQRTPTLDAGFTHTGLEGYGCLRTKEGNREESVRGVSGSGSRCAGCGDGGFLPSEAEDGLRSLSWA